MNELKYLKERVYPLAMEFLKAFLFGFVFHGGWKLWRWGW